MNNYLRLNTRLFPPLALRLIAFAALTLVMLWAVGVGQASSTILVNTTEDVKKGNDGFCSLREAIIAANSDKASGGKRGECVAGSGADTILLPAGTYTLSRTDNGNEDAAETGDLDISDDLKIVGAGSGQTIIDANGISDRVLHILDGKVEIFGVTITKNGGTIAGDGSGVRNNGNLTLTNSTITNSSTDGEGGGIYNTGVLTLNNSTVSHNTAEKGGGLSNATSGSMALNNSTVSDNSAISGVGGGIYNLGILELHNNTIADNTGHGLANSDASGRVDVRDTIIANNNPRDCSGTLSSLGYNLAGDATCNLSGAGDVTNVAPRLGPLQNNGGETETHALLPDSPAIDSGDPNGCYGSAGLLTFDQRGEPRPMDGDHDRVFRCDVGAFESGGTTLVLTRAKTDGTIDGRLSSAANTTFNLEFYATDSCPSGFGPVDDATFLDPTPDPNQPIQVQTDAYGNVYFTATVTPPGVRFVYGLAILPDGGTSEFSQCVPVGPGNTSWPNALSLDAEPSYPPTALIEQYVDKFGQSRWYKFSIQPGSKVIVTLTGVDGGPLPVNLDMTVYRDITATFLDLLYPQNVDLARLNAEFAGEAFSGEAFSGEAFSSDAFSGEAFSGEAFSGEAFSGEAFSGEAFSGEAFSGEAFSSDAFSADVYTGEAFSGEAFSGEAFSGEAFSGEAFSGEAFSDQAYNAIFSSAQTRSLLGVSAFEGTASEGIRLNTWNNTGEFYVRVRGRNGAFSLDAPFLLTVVLEPGSCGAIDPLPDRPAIGTGGDNPRTIILYDSSRLNRIEDSDKIDLVAQLTNLASHSAVGGKLVDVSQDPRVNFANSQADAHPTCPYAKNLVVQAIKDIIDGYRTQPGSNLEYIVVVGGDDVIPFARVPDDALLANEQNYFPPVRDDTASQASLRLGYVLTQDAYGSTVDLALKNSSLPVPGLAIGRLVETAPEINAVVEAFLSTDGVVTPQTSLAVGYDFLFDAATAIQAELRQGIGGDDTTSPALIIPGGGPSDPDAWTADDLRQYLIPESGFGPDIAFLAGHFTGNSALAADYDTRLLASEVAGSSVDMTNAIIFSIGCHAGYNIVNQHDIPNVTREPDWAQAFASKGATLIAGTAYQYGDTDLLKYSEFLYLEFSRQLRLQDAGGPISIGQALVEAKRAYLLRTPHIGGLDEKALLEATIFGLPMLKVDLNRDYVPTLPPTVQISPTYFGTNPGLELGLAYDDVTVESPSPLWEHQSVLRDVVTGDPLDEPASYLEGFNGFDANPGEPILPLEVRDVTWNNTVLRGVGFRGGTYTEVDVIPLISSATTERSGVHTPFLTDYLYPIQLQAANYFDVLGDGSRTLLMVTPAQHRTSTIFGDPQKSTRRQFSSMDFRLYYSNNTATFAGDPDHPSTPALSAPPAIISVSDVISDIEVTFNATVVGNPSAGIQEVWVTYTICDPDDLSRDGEWKPLDLAQDPADSSQWGVTRTLQQLGVSDLTVDNICYIVQAVNGVGLVSQADNLGLFFRVGVDVEPTVATNLEFWSPAPNSSGPFGTKNSFSAKLTALGGQPLPGQIVTFRLGAQTRRAETDSNGDAIVELALIGEPGDANEVKVSFAGAGIYKPSDDTLPFNIWEQGTTLVLDPQHASGRADAAKIMTATLKTADDRPLFEKTLVFRVTGSGGSHTEAVITNFAGRAYLGDIPLPRGEYTVDVSFDDPLITGLEDDPLYGSSSASGSLALLNSPPVAENDTFSIHTYELSVATPGVLGNDSDRDDDPISAWLVAQPTKGSVTLNSDGSFTYVPDATFNSADDTDTFVYKANDGFDDSDEAATVTIVPSLCFLARAEIWGGAPSIWPPNGAFVPVDVTIDASASILVTGIFQDEPVGNTGPDGRFVDADTIEVRAERDGQGNGRVYHIFFSVDDGLGNVCQGEVRVPVVDHDQSGDVGDFDEGALYDSTVAPKFAPVANDDQFTIEEDQVASGNVLANDTDRNNDPLTAIKVSDPLNGTVTLAPNGDFNYTPTPDFNGQDSFTYRASDGELESNLATVTITVNPVNDAPHASDDSATTVQDVAVNVAVLANDTDVDGDALAVSSVTQGANGSVVIEEDSTVTYEPNTGFTGADSFTYIASDGELESNLTTVTISIGPVNSPPVANDDSATIEEDQAVNIDVLANDVDANGDTLTVEFATQPANGSVVNNTSDVSYTPDADFCGSDVFMYTASDGKGGSDTATVTVEVACVNDAPSASDDSATTNENAAVTIDVAANDTDVDGNLSPTSATITSGPSNGTVFNNGDGTFSYTPVSGFNGADSFMYQICDTEGLCDTATVNVTINPVNDPPEATDDLVQTDKGTPVTIDVLANDSDPNDDVLTVIAFSEPARGTVTPNADGTLTYTPASKFKGTDTFTYTISDGKGGTDTATVTIMLE